MQPLTFGGDYPGCTTLWSEDMQDGLLVEGQLRIINPFA